MTKPKCPFLKKPCWEHDCTLYMQLIGKNPNTGQPVDEWGCAITWTVITNMENAQKTNQLGASIDSFRNEMTRQNTAFAGMIKLILEEDHEKAFGIDGKTDDKLIEHN